MVVLRVWFLEAVEGRVGVVFGEPSIRLTFLWHLYYSVLGRCHFDLLCPHFDLVHMCHGYQNEKHDVGDVTDGDLRKPAALTTLCLRTVTELDQCIVLLIEHDLDANHVSVYT